MSDKKFHARDIPLALFLGVFALVCIYLVGALCFVLFEGASSLFAPKDKSTDYEYQQAIADAYDRGYSAGYDEGRFDAESAAEDELRYFRIDAWIDGYGTGYYDRDEHRDYYEEQAYDIYK